MDKIFYNGIIKTFDKENRIEEAVGIKDGKIAFVGNKKEALTLQYKEAVDLQGKLMLPGFVDGHLHLIHYAFVESTVKLFDCKSVEEIVSLAKNKLKEQENENPKWLFSRGWDEKRFDVKRYPTKADADAVSTTIPVVFVRVCGHAAVINSVGLERLKKISEFETVKNEIDFETGLIKENAVQFFYSVLEKPSQEHVELLIRSGIKKLNEKGITGVQTEDLSSLPGKDWQLILNSYNNLQLKNQLSVRIYEQCLFEQMLDFEKFINRGYRGGQSGEFFTVGPLKILMDGSIGAKTAAMTDGYVGDSENLGIVNYSIEQLVEMMDLAMENAMHVVVHCIGDRAMEMVIEAMRISQKKSDRVDVRNGIVHAQITNSSILEKMKQYGIAAYIQPVFVNSDMDIVESRIGKERMHKIYAWKSMIDMGILTVGGSDAPVESFDIMENIYYAVTREKLEGGPKNGWLPEEKLDVEEAVKLFTVYPSYMSFTENVNGTIEVGKRADLVVLEENIFEVEVDKIKDIKISKTIVDGKMVYQA
ncbi:amidohydrolase [Anaerovorax sp. IOR16]|uniref:amidohydrolase n=1 Tax=Anaerovorax sp. IOR16 TaxID=2773458 RepID=UPI0019CF7F79|nr:amidohydrolase [Anaerovorax sp. IOR16]